MKTVRAISELRLELESVRQSHAPTGPASRPVQRSIDGVTVADHDGAKVIVGNSIGLLPTNAIGLVPTMGALHEGHLSLIGRAREQCATVVVSLFVNPTQFDEPSDLDRYPRQERRDADLAADAGADILFVPSAAEIYPAGFATSVEVSGLTDCMEGKVRGAAHFKGVTTVVTKLLNIVAPDVAYFGQKDAQQVAVIRRLVEDLNLPVAIAVCPTQRERDGLAMSSRNARLSQDQRRRAIALFRALESAGDLASQGERSAEKLVHVAREAMTPFDVQPEYLVLVDPDTLEPVTHLEGPALLAIAARVGETRLIDNAILEPSPDTVTSSRSELMPTMLAG